MATQAHAQLDEEAAPPPRCIVSGNVTNGVNALRDRSWKTFSHQLAGEDSGETPKRYNAF